MPRATKKCQKVIDEVLERLTVGETMVSIFSDAHLPSKRAFNAWRLKDKELDEQVFTAMRRGYQEHADEAVSTQLKIMRGEFKGDPKQAQAAVTAANNLRHQALAKLSKLDNRYKDRQEVTYTGPMIIGWDTSDVESDVSDVENENPLSDQELDNIIAEDIVN